MSHHTTTRTWPLSFGEPARLRFAADAGKVVVVPVRAGEEPRLELSGPDADRAAVDVDVEDDTVVVTVDCLNEYVVGLQESRVTMTLHVPPALHGVIETDVGSIDGRGLGRCDLTLRTDAGRIRLEGAQGRLRLSTDAGSIEARRLTPCDVEAVTGPGRIHIADARGRLRLVAGEGEVVGDAIAGSIDAQSNLGAIRLAIRALDAGEHHVRTGTGMVDVELARGIDARIVPRVAVGSTQIEFPSRPDAAAVLNIATQVGSVRVRGGPPDDATGAETEEHAGAVAGAPPASPDRDRGPAAGREAEVERILKMVEAGRLSAREANDLLAALETA